jgi:hypothetical protein
MRTWLSFYRQMLVNLIAVRIDGGETVVTSPGGQQRRLPVWAIVLIALFVLALCAIGACLLIPVILTLLGPSIGNVFSNVIEELETPVP